jgi:nickel/cobalt exporter
VIEPTDGLALSMISAAAFIGFTHTILGADHYLPFVALARAQRWSWRRTILTVSVCGLGHVMGSMLLATLGLFAGVLVGQFESLQGIRGDWAAWTLVALGFAYGAWGVREAMKRGGGYRAHAHGHDLHIHREGGLSHEHAHDARPSALSFWMLLVVFILGPCEPLIPLFVLPASRGRWDIALATFTAFAVTTLATMLMATFLGLAGLKNLRIGNLERWVHAMAGAAIASSGFAVIALGL